MRSPTRLAIAWRRTPSTLVLGAPILWGNTVVVAKSRSLTEYNLADGAVIWRSAVPNAFRGAGTTVASPTLLPDGVHVDAVLRDVVGNGTVTFDATDGTYTTTGAAYHQLRSKLAVDGTDSALLTGSYGTNFGPFWFMQYAGHSWFASGGTVSISSGVAFLTTPTGITGYDSSGPCLPGPIPNPPSDCMSSWSAPDGTTTPTPAGAGRIATTNASGVVTLLDIHTGAVIGATAPLGTSLGPASYADGLIYVGGADGRLRVIDAASLNLIWSGDAGAAITTAPTLSATTVYVATAKGRLAAFAMNCTSTTCAPVAIGNAGLPTATTGSAPLVGDGRVVVVWGRNIVAFAI